MFCKGMVKGPLKDLIRIPNEEEATEIARRFEAAHGVREERGTDALTDRSLKD